MKTCETCKWWDCADGECRCFLRQTNKDDFCGEWEKKDGKEA
jgi:hypothetical protein